MAKTSSNGSNGGVGGGVFLDYIPDGYEEQRYIAPAERMHGELRFKFRPCTPAERTKFLSAAQAGGPEQADRVAASAISQKLISWSLVDAGGKSVPVTIGNIGRLKPVLFSKLWAVVLGSDPGDEDPLANEEKQQRDAELLVESVLSGQPIAAVSEGADLKN